MKTFVKKYIAKGKRIGEMQIVKISCKISDILEHAHEYKGEEYITFEVAKLQNPDSFGNEYTVYVNKLVETEKTVEKSQVNESKTAKPGKGSKKPVKSSKKQAEPKNDEFPF